MKSSIFTFAVSIFISAVASGQSLTGVAPAAMGGAGRAGVDAGSIAFLNPASMAHLRGYNIVSAYRYYSVNPEGGGHDYFFHGSENQTDSLFPLGVTYAQSKIDFPLGHAKKREIHLTSAQMLGANFAFGIDFGRYDYQVTSSKKEAHWDSSLGLMYVATPQLGFGLVFGNYLKTDFPFLKRNIQFGTNYLFQDFLRAALDIVYQTEDNPDHKSIIMAGLEHRFLETLPLRLGYRYDGLLGKRYTTAGFGWDGPRLGIDYAFEKNLSKSRDYAHWVDVRVYF